MPSPEQDFEFLQLFEPADGLVFFISVSSKK
jgi:hypothetical protein